MAQLEHAFTAKIRDVLETMFGDKAEMVFAASPLLQYLNIKTRSADRGSKARGSFANLYALYVLIEDYVHGSFDENGKYAEYDGATFSAMFKRQRELPFGSKLQNHALNHRLNEEFKKFFRDAPQPILRDATTGRYWVNESLLKVGIGGGENMNIAHAVLAIVDAYVDAKRAAFDSFVEDCERLRAATAEDASEAETFMRELLRPNVDARLFEIVSFAILKASYGTDVVFWGWAEDALTEEALTLYKTGRTNANDGGIDFVMRPLGKFFQVTETLDVGKYFLDIDKIQRYPITFVIKSESTVREIRETLQSQAAAEFTVDRIVERYMKCIEEIINIPILVDRFNEAVAAGHLEQILDEVILQSKVEFNYDFELDSDSLDAATLAEDDADVAEGSD